MTTGFDRKRYWEDRRREEYSPEGTGFKGLGEGLNKWMYRVQRRNFLSVCGRSFQLGRRRGFFTSARARASLSTAGTSWAFAS